jgi:hypothetical protein
MTYAGQISYLFKFLDQNLDSSIGANRLKACINITVLIAPNEGSNSITNAFAYNGVNYFKLSTVINNRRGAVYRLL